MNIRSAAAFDSTSRAGSLARADVPAAQAASWISLALDAVVIVATSLLTGTVFHSLFLGVVGDLSLFAATGAIVAVFFCALVRFQAGRDERASVTRFGRARMAVTAWATTFLFLIVLAFGMKISSHFSRGSLLSFFIVGLVCVSLSRAIVPRLLSRWTSGSAHNGHEALLIVPGSDVSGNGLLEDLRSLGYKAVHPITFDDCCTGTSWITERRRLLKNVFDAARLSAQGEIYVVPGKLPFDAAVGIITGLRLLPRAILFVPEHHIRSLLLQHPMRGVGETVALEIQRTPMSSTQRALKRATDITIAATALFFIWPLMIVIALAIKLDSSGPILFWQKRLGYRGQPFDIAKFRTMHVLEDGDLVRQATRGDSRVTRVGAWLRKSSLDELPQLWNVLRSEMSIVGPRPHAIAHDLHFAKLIENYEVRQHVKPGLTGWAQVQGLRGETPHLDLMYRRIEADLWYASNSSLSLDVRILFKTLGLVLSYENAF